jgi:hypothetical protein
MNTNRSTTRTNQGATTHAQIDQGLRSYMLRVYNYMTGGLALTGIIALYTANSPQILQTIYGTPLQWMVMLAPLGFVFFLSARINKISASTAQTLFWVYSGLMGLSLSYIFLAYTGESITRVFFISAGTFGAMSLYGYTTKRDLSGVGSFLYMGLIGIVIASLVNLFMQSSAFEFAISVIGVIVFTGLTAYDTQKIRQMYVAGEGTETATKKAVMGALNLYLDFINLFIMLLRLLGDRR